MEVEVKIESISRMECLSCKKLAKHCKCKTPNHQMVTVEYRTETPILPNSDGHGQRSFESESERLASIQKRFIEKQNKKEARKELSEIMSMDPEDLAEKRLKEEMDGRKMPAVEDMAKSMVDDLDEMKRDLTNQGLSARDVAKAIKEHKRKLRGGSSEESEDEQESEEVEIVAEEKTPSLPDLDIEVDEPALASPVKDPTTGKFIEQADANQVENKPIKRGRTPKKAE